MLPFFQRIDVFPFLGYPADCNYLVEKGGRRRNTSEKVGRLASVVSDQLNDVLKGSELGFGRLKKNG